MELVSPPHQEDKTMISDVISNYTNTGQQPQVQQSVQQGQESIEQTAREIKTETEVPIVSPKAVEAVQNAVPEAVNPNSLRFRVRDDEVSALIVNPEGAIVKTIPPSDLQQIMRDNSLPSIGRFFEGRA